MDLKPVAKSKAIQNLNCNYDFHYGASLRGACFVAWVRVGCSDEIMILKYTTLHCTTFTFKDAY